MEVALVYPHQLFDPHPALGEGRTVFLIEDPLFFGNDPHWPAEIHRQKLILHRASMKAFAAELEAAGETVLYIDSPAGSTADSRAILENHLPKKVRSLHVTDPVDDVLSRRIRRFARARNVELVVHESPNFLTPADFLQSHTGMPEKPFMARFYQAQRKRMALMVEKDGSPAGGQWSFDSENRARYPKKSEPPAEPQVRPNDFVNEAICYIRKRFPDRPGDLDGFRWPVTRSDAQGWLDQFIDERLAGFGPYEDAISTRHPFLHHSALTPALNIGLLDPGGVVARVMAHAARNRVPINSLEGFIRQITGWREFVCGIYRHRGTTIRNGNFWNFERPLPPAFRDGTTGIPPVDRVIQQVLREGWCHHIERLMILGNFMLLCRIRPGDVYRWFMELFVDAYDWVMVPNIYGMSQFADGGTFTTKPYLSGSNYILKMSDEPKGPWCGVWDGLFWTFIADYEGFFLDNPRLSMMARNWRNMPVAKQRAHREEAEHFLLRMNPSP